jgi:hypothetical protein
MKTRTSKLWAEQDRHPSDRHRLFSAVSTAVPSSSVLYPGSWVDIAPSFVFDDVTYVDTDHRSGQFFDDPDGVDEIIAEHRQPASSTTWRFIHADYSSDLSLPDGHFDLLVSLYAGFVSEHCTRYLRPGGHLLVNSSHGDAAMASIDPAFRLVAVVQSRSGGYSVTDKDLGSYLVPKTPTTITAETLHKSGRGVAYTKPVFAYVFQRLDLKA